MELLSDFSSSYAEADQRFVEHARARGFDVQSYSPALEGPDGESLHTRVARLGRPDARRVALIQSGTHGIEGYVGSAAQLGWLRAGDHDLPDDLAVVLVHAINPHGFAWGYRETQERVDLNRNFRDFGSPLPKNPGYAALHDAFCCPAMDGPIREAADRAIAEFRDMHGERAFLVALASGQYEREGGLYFGGLGPTWSNQTFRAILASLGPRLEALTLVDIHSGLGPFGYGMPITLAPARSEQLQRTREAFGSSVVAPLEEDDSFISEIGGTVMQAASACLPERQVSSIALEFGTYSTDNDTETYRNILWLRDHGDWDGPEGHRIRAAFREHFCPAAEDWREMTWLRSQQVIRQAINAIA